MRNRFAFLLVAVALFSGAAQARADEQILRYDSHVAIAPDGELTVTETIRVRAEGREIRRGIYRDFPLTFRDAGGATRTVPFTLIDVTRDNRPEPQFSQKLSNRIRSYAGCSDGLFARGVQSE
ncbi:MAG: DUF2207 domain-containing protein, partial [Xanthobacteraceae bacterium]